MMRRAGCPRAGLQLLLLLALAVLPALLHAAGPRWIAGSQWANEGKPMGWYRTDVQYFVDQGPLNAAIDHDTAAALVDAAASVWKADGLSFSLARGGDLAEDVSGANVYQGVSGIVWPQDLRSSNYQAKQIAVVFDTDGSVTDLLLGSGASDPANCRQAAVTESVDLFIQPGKIAHALLIVNGRCAGGAPVDALQLRYGMMRAFGRIVGLGWSQTNDNVFTGVPAPSYAQQMHWPILHPIDIVCGTYTYQCLPQPFTLREDDVASLAMVYAANINSGVPGRVITTGWITFPNGMGMNGVHVAAQRQYPWDGYGIDPYEVVSGVAGMFTRIERGNPVVAPAVDAWDNGGTFGNWAAGYFVLYGIPLLPQYSFMDILVSTAAINPLYVGPYAVGPYRALAPAPSGSSLHLNAGAASGGFYQGLGYQAVADAASACNGGADGTEDNPALVPADGVWSGRFCGVSHSAWSRFPVRAGRTATLEVLALDEAGAGTTAKAAPVAGLWHGADPTGTLPTLARVASPFNSTLRGNTQLRVAFRADETVRMVLADKRGDGRPDYTYRARLLYADTVQPARLPPAGGAIRIVGTGFQPGSMVTVGGVVATVISLLPQQIDALAPPLSALGGNAVNDVSVVDPTTHASTTVSQGLTYAGASADSIAWAVALPSSQAVNAPALAAWRVTDSAGLPAGNAVVTVSTSGGSAVWSTCGLPTCTLVTDSSGSAAAQIVAGAAGTVTVTATLRNGAAVQGSFAAVAPARAVTLLRPVQYVAAAGGTVFHPMANLSGDGASSAAVSWTSSSELLQFSGAEGSGTARSITATAALREGESAAVQVCAWSTVCASQQVFAVSPNDLRVVPGSGEDQSVPSTQMLESVSVRVVDTAGHPVAGASVNVYQQVTGWQPACSISRCPAPPVYARDVSTAQSDDDGFLTITPLQFAATAADTRITVTAGTTAALNLLLQKTPDFPSCGTLQRAVFRHRACRSVNVSLRRI